MPIIEPPKTLEEFKAVETSILELMGNPYCDHIMFMSLTDKLKKCREKIQTLCTQPKTKQIYEVNLYQCKECGLKFN